MAHEAAYVGGAEKACPLSWVCTFLAVLTLLLLVQNARGLPSWHLCPPPPLCSMPILEPIDPTCTMPQLNESFKHFVTLHW